MVKLLIQAGADLEIQHKVHIIILWERFMLAHAVCDIAAWDEAMTIINVVYTNEGASWNVMHRCKHGYGHTV